MIRYLEGSTEVTAGGNLKVLFLGAWIGSVVGLVIDFNKSTVLGLLDGKLFGRTLWDLVGI